MGLDPEAQAALLAYDWPGNVRELQNVLERALVLAAQDVIGPEHLPAEIRSGERRELTEHTARQGGVRMVPLAQVEREHVLAVLEAAGGNRERAARTLRISRRTLTRMLQRWGMIGAGADGGPDDERA